RERHLLSFRGRCAGSRIPRLPPLQARRRTGIAGAGRNRRDTLACAAPARGIGRRGGPRRSPRGHRPAPAAALRAASRSIAGGGAPDAPPAPRAATSRDLLAPDHRRRARRGLPEPAPVQRSGPPRLRPHSFAARIQRAFDLRADPAPIAEHLGRDPILKPYLRPGLRIPGAWDPFEMAVRAVLGQQISVQRARAMAAALIARFAGFPTAAQLADAELDGMPAIRATAIAQLARSVVDGRVRLDGSQDLETVTAALCEIVGIGDWTAQVIAL